MATPDQFVRAVDLVVENAPRDNAFINGGENETWQTRSGAVRPTASKALRDLALAGQAAISDFGYRVPVPYAAGLSITSATQTVTYEGQKFSADPSALPFTTAGTFNPAQWRLIGEGLSADQVLRVSPAVDPSYYGAVGDGDADDTVALASAASAGKRVFINKPTRVSGTTDLGRLSFGPEGRIVVSINSIITLSVDGDPMGQQIFDTTSGGVIKVAQNWVRPDWWGNIQRNILIAIDALPENGGDVLLLPLRYPLQRTVFNGYQVVKPNISLIGTGTPRYNEDCTSIEGGTVIQGRFNVFADSFHHENIGYDFGRTVCETFYPGMDTHTANHPDGFTWDAFAFAVPGGNLGTRPRRGYSARNVIGLLRDPFSVGHAILQEGIVDGDVQNVFGCGGVHAFVFKSMFVRARNVGGYGASENNLIIKSDSYAECRSVKLDQYEADFYPPGCTGWWGQTPARNGIHLQCAAANLGQVSLAGGTIRGSRRTLYTSGGAGFSIADLQMSDHLFDGFGITDGIDYTGQFTKTTGMLFEAERHFRMQMGDVLINNVTDGVVATQQAPLSTEEFSFNSMKITNWSGVALKAIAQARIKIAEFHGNTGNDVYYEESTSRILIGTERFVAVTGGKFTTVEGSGIPTTGIVYLTGWSSAGGSNPPFVLKKDNYGMLAVGSLSKTSGGTVEIGLIPSFLRTQADFRSVGSLYANAPFQPTVLVMAPGGQFNVDSPMPADTSLVFLGQLRWEVV